MKQQDIIIYFVIIPFALFTAFVIYRSYKLAGNELTQAFAENCETLKCLLIGR